MKKIIIAVLLIFTVFISANKPIDAIKQGEGTLHILNESSSLELTNAQIELNVNKAGEGLLTANYNINNPTDKKQRLSLAIPYAENVEIKVNDGLLAAQKRHTLMNQLTFSDDYYSDSLYNESLVQKLTYQITSASFDDYPDLVISEDFSYDKNKTHFITSTDNINHELINAHKISNWVKKDTLFELYVIGEKINAAEIEWDFFKNSRLVQPVEGQATLLKEEEISLKTILLQDKPEEVSAIDWYNSKINLMLNDHNAISSFKELEITNQLAEYFVYHLEVEAQSSINHFISQKIPMQVDDSYRPAIYHYTISLKDLEKLAKYENIQLKLHTDWFLFEPALAFNQQKEARLDDLSSAIIISLSTSANPEPNVDMLELSIKVIVSSIALLVLIALLIMPKKIQKNYRLNDYELHPKVLRLYRLQNLLAILALLLSLIGMHYKTYFSALALVIISVAFIVALVAHFKALQANAVGIIALALAITSSANLFYYSHNIFEVNTVIVNVAILVYGINNLVLYNNIEYNKEEDHYYLPLDFLSKKAFVFYVIFVLLIMFSGMTILVFTFRVINVFIITLVNLLLIIIYRLIKVYLVDYQAIHQYYQNLDYPLLKIRMEARLGNDMIHPKTYNGYLFRLAEIALTNSMDDYVKYVSSFKPLAKLNDQVDFDVLRLNYLMSRREFFNFYQELRIKYHDHPLLLNKVHKRYQFYLPYYNGEVGESIVLEYPYKLKNKWQSARNLFIQINHYVARENYGKARELAKLFKRRYANMKLLSEEINKLNLNRL